MCRPERRADERRALLQSTVPKLCPAAVNTLLALPEQKSAVNKSFLGAFRCFFKSLTGNVHVGRAILRHGFASHAQIKSLLQECYNYIDSADYTRSCTACGRIVFETVALWMPISAHRVSVQPAGESRAKEQLP